MNYARKAVKDQTFRSWRVLPQCMNLFPYEVWDSPGCQLRWKGPKKWKESKKKKKKCLVDFGFVGFPVHTRLYHVWTCKEYTWLFARNPVNGECVNQFPAVCLSHLITPACPFPEGTPLLLEHLVPPEEGTKCLGLGSAGAGNHRVGTRAGGGHLTHKWIKIYLQIFPSVSTSQLSSRARWFKRCVAFHCWRPKYTKKLVKKSVFLSLPRFVGNSGITAQLWHNSFSPSSLFDLFHVT